MGVHIIHFDAAPQQYALCAGRSNTRFRVPRWWDMITHAHMYILYIIMRECIMKPSFESLNLSSLETLIYKKKENCTCYAALPVFVPPKPKVAYKSRQHVKERENCVRFDRSICLLVTPISSIYLLNIRFKANGLNWKIARCRNSSGERWWRNKLFLAVVMS